MRRLLHIKGDVICTLLLLVLFCLLLYVRQVRLEPITAKADLRAPEVNPLCLQVLVVSGWDQPAWKLQIHNPSSSSRTLMGAGGTKTEQRPSLV